MKKETAITFFRGRAAAQIGPRQTAANVFPSQTSHRHVGFDVRMQIKS